MQKAQGSNPNTCNTDSQQNIVSDTQFYKCVATKILMRRKSWVCFTVIYFMYLTAFFLFNRTCY